MGAFERKAPPEEIQKAIFKFKDSRNELHEVVLGISKKVLKHLQSEISSTEDKIKTPPENIKKQRDNKNRFPGI